jgi:hypothetical protein
VLVLAGCGGARPGPAAPAGAPCDEVANHLVALAERDNAAAAGASLAGGIRGETLRQCTSAPWSPARRDCLVAARTQDETLACPAD